MAGPYQINASANDGEFFPYGPDKSVYRYGNLYQPLNLGGGPPYYIGIRKSINNGVTWSEEDSANHPQVASTPFEAASQFDDGEDLWFAYSSDASSPPPESIVQQFDVSVGAWQTPITGAPASKENQTPASFDANSRAQLGLIRRPNGELVLIYSEVVADYHTLNFVVYASGSWGSPITLLEDGFNESAGAAQNYALLGAVLFASGRIGVAAWSNYGFVSIMIETNNSLSGYRRRDQNGLTADLLYARKIWGKPIVITLGGSEWMAVPLAMMPSSSNDYVPVVLLVPDSNPFQMDKLEFQSETLTSPVSASYSISLSQDASTGALYLAWNRYVAGGTEIRMCCTKGFLYSAPSTLLTFDYATYPDKVSAMEITAENGVLRMTASAYQQGGNVWYWQDAITCSAAGCPATSASTNQYQIT